MTTETVASALAKREKDKPAAAGTMVKQYRDDFAMVLPTHVKPATWVRLAQGALKKGKKADGDPYGRTELEVAACNNPSAFLAALLEAARLGLEPGTEQYYLTPRKIKGRLEILGIVGYQGYVELMYNAGAVTSVVAEVVYTNDIFRFRPGTDDIPHHEIDWDSDNRGELRLVYAFARMEDGVTSKVIVLNKTAIAQIQEVSPSSGYAGSPWQMWPAQMWLKSAVRQLQKWVPTSAELRRRKVMTERGEVDEPFLLKQTDRGEAADGALPVAAIDPPVTDITDTWTESGGDGVVEGEVVTEPASITETQSQRMHAILTEGQINRETKLALLTHLTGRDITTSANLTKTEAATIIKKLTELARFKIPLIEAVVELIDRPAGGAT